MISESEVVEPKKARYDDGSSDIEPESKVRKLNLL